MRREWKEGDELARVSQMVGVKLRKTMGRPNQFLVDNSYMVDPVVKILLYNNACD